MMIIRHSAARAHASALTLLAASAATVAVLVTRPPRISGAVTSWRGDDLALATAWLVAITCAVWLVATMLASLGALICGQRALAHRIAGWAPPIARRVLHTALIGSWALVPSYAYASAAAPLTVHVSPAGRLVGAPPTNPPAEIPVVRGPRPAPATERPTARGGTALPPPPSTVAPAPVPAAAPRPSASSTHLVRPRENLWRIARAEVTRASPDASPDERAVAAYWQRVVAANRSTLRSGDPSLIFPGEVVTLPAV
jgi:hypothetical protein